MKKILILGVTGKLGTSIFNKFRNSYDVTGVSSKDFDVSNFNSLINFINKNSFDIIINCVARLGIDPCELEPLTAHKLNTALPKLLAEKSKGNGFILIHFSTDAVFADKKNGKYNEDDRPSPINIYGYTKYFGDLYIQNIAEKYYIIRIPLIFGISKNKNQFFEKMIEKIGLSKEISIADDIITTPTYSVDVATTLFEMIENNKEYGLYHVNNSGEVSLFGLINEYVKIKKYPVSIKKSSYKDFDHIGRKNTQTILSSKKLPKIRNWKLALNEYISHGV